MTSPVTSIRSVSIALLSAVSLAGCSIPPLIDDNFVSVGEVVEHVRCELRQAREEYPQLNDWVGAFGLNLIVLANQSADLSADWVILMPGTNTLKLTPSLGASNKVRREGNMKFDIVFRELPPGPCPSVERPGLYRLYGDFGLKEWIGKILTQHRIPPKQFDYTLEFGLKVSAGIKPVISIVRLTDTNTLSADRTDTHTLTVTFARRIDPPMPSAQVVCVANLPGATKCDQVAIKRVLDEQKPPQLKSLIDQGREPAGLDPWTRQMLYQQLDILRLRDQLQR